MLTLFLNREEIDLAEHLLPIFVQNLVNHRPSRLGLDPEAYAVKLLHYLMPLMGTKIEPKGYTELSWRLAGVPFALAEGVTPEYEMKLSTQQYETMALITDYFKGSTDRRGKTKVGFKLRLLTSKWCGHEFATEFSAKYWRWVMGRGNGFPVIKGLRSPREFVQGRFIVRVGVDSREKLAVFAVLESGSCATANRKLRKARETCPYNYKHACYNCCRGYADANPLVSCSKAVQKHFSIGKGVETGIARKVRGEC